MKTKSVLLLLFIGLISMHGFSENIDPKEQEEKKTTRSKYDLNIFKLISIDTKHQDIDSTKTIFLKTPTRKEE